MGNKNNIFSMDYSSQNVFTIYANGDNSYGSISRLNDSNLNIKKLWVFNFQCFAIDVFGNLMSWGLNNYYQLGNTTYNNYLFNDPNSIKDSFNYIYSYNLPEYYLKKLNIANLNYKAPFSGKDIKKIDGGDGFTLFLLKNGELFGCGRNDKLQLGIDISYEKYELVSGKKCLKFITKNEYFSKNNIKIKDIFCGSDFSFALDNKNNYYSWGNNEYYQLLRQSNNLYANLPEKVEKLKQFDLIIKLKLGWSHGAILTNNNDLYIWGNPFYDYDKNFKTIKDLYKINLPNNNDMSLKIVDISSGFNHISCLVINNNEKYFIYTFGANEFGQLGYNTQESYTLIPKEVKIKEEGTITDIECGAFHTIVRYNNDNIYGFGQNNCGQIGDYKDDFINFPVKYNYKTDVNLYFLKIICANASTVLIKIPNIIEESKIKIYESEQYININENI